jgi:hypothetical protein
MPKRWNDEEETTPMVPTCPKNIMIYSNDEEETTSQGRPKSKMGFNGMNMTPTKFVLFNTSRPKSNIPLKFRKPRNETSRRI